MDQAASRYQVLQNEDESGTVSAEPSTSSHPSPGTLVGISNPALEIEAPPPPYTSLTLGATAAAPEKAKAAAMAASAVEVVPRDEDFPVRDDISDADQLRVGNDGIFLLAFFSKSSLLFLVAFVFNWIGFCLSFCLSNTIAGRYGAICGFGLSLFSDYFTGYFNGQYWLWWIFLVLGLLLFFRGFVNYLKVRNMSESMVSSMRTRFFLLY
ncbi:hypothetical protein DNTS_027506 [Danionella cerebrum]|uniref:Nedd4 family interacting protein 2 n=1 Tax=Danionella cerebrum TaxID=2873325 RepID=A0A553RJP6_9TELE|nr:hypothetical protein DNTS_027506 [Danionella translucida]